MSYPLPSYAASIWLDGETLWLAFPSASGRGHKVYLSADQYGLTCALRILREREIHGGAAKLNEPSAPSQALLDMYANALLRNQRVNKDKKQETAKEAAEFLKEIGLI
jgi:hypothetical protein